MRILFLVAAVATILLLGWLLWPALERAGRGPVIAASASALGEAVEPATTAGGLAQVVSAGDIEFPTHWTCDLDEFDEEFEPDTAALIAALRDVGGPDALVAAAQLAGGDDTLARDLLDRALDLDPDNRMAHWMRLRICAESTIEASCDEAGVVQAALAADADNGAMWSVAADFWLRRDDDEQALAALERAAVQSRYTRYGAERIVNLIQALEIVRPDGFNIQFLRARNVVVGRPYKEAWLLTCLKRAPTEQRWRAACVDHAESAQRLAPELNARQPAQSFLSFLYKKIGDEQNESRIAREGAAISWGGLWAENDLVLHIFVWSHDPVAARQYLEDSLTLGEAQAIRNMDKTITRLIADPSYNPCAP